MIGAVFVWLNEVATVVGPLATIVGFLGGLAALIIYARKIILAVGQAKEESTRAAESAENASVQAVSAGRHAEESKDNSRQANEAVMFMATELAKANTGNEYLKDRVNDLLAALARERAVRPVADEYDDDAEETGLITITGRHRLHTRMIPTVEDDE